MNSPPLKKTKTKTKTKKTYFLLDQMGKDMF